MMRYRLKDNHPARMALDKICNLADELGIKIDFMGHRTRLIFDGVDYELLDNEDGTPVAEVPPQLEYKLIYEKEGD